MKTKQKRLSFFSFVAERNRGKSRDAAGDIAPAPNGRGGKSTKIGCNESPKSGFIGDNIDGNPADDGNPGPKADCPIIDANGEGISLGNIDGGNPGPKADCPIIDANGDDRSFGNIDCIPDAANNEASPADEGSAGFIIGENGTPGRTDGKGDGVRTDAGVEAAPDVAVFEAVGEGVPVAVVAGSGDGGKTPGGGSIDGGKTPPIGGIPDAIAD